jgi:YHS domain-containing protein
MLALLAGPLGLRADERNEKCPLMVSEDVDEEQLIEYEGVKVYFCCQHCRKIWNRNQKYIIKASRELLPQFEGMAEKLELGKVELLLQRFCPVNPGFLVTPDSPSVEHGGVRVYFWDEEAKAVWEKDPAGWAKRAAERLPQLPKAAQKR